MSWNLHINGHKDHGSDPKEIERNEALVTAEIERLLPRIKSRLERHGLHTVSFYGSAVTKHFDLDAVEPATADPSGAELRST